MRSARFASDDDWWKLSSAAVGRIAGPTIRCSTLHSSLFCLTPKPRAAPSPTKPCGRTHHRAMAAATTRRARARRTPHYYHTHTHATRTRLLTHHPLGHHPNTEHRKRWATSFSGALSPCSLLPLLLLPPNSSTAYFAHPFPLPNLPLTLSSPTHALTSHLSPLLPYYYALILRNCTAKVLHSLYSSKALIYQGKLRRLRSTLQGSAACRLQRVHDQFACSNSSSALDLVTSSGHFCIALSTALLTLRIA